MKKLSDLEMAILGIVWKRAPCTAYVVAKEFSSSPSSHWRGSAGAVYPAMTRLLGLGLLKRQPRESTGQRRSLYTLSSPGKLQLRRWLRPPLPEAAASITFDPLRTRAFFLGVLAEAEQVAFVQAAQQRLEAELPRLEAECVRYREAGDWFSAQAQRGAVLVARARLAWMRQLQAALARRGAERDRSTTSASRKG